MSGEVAVGVPLSNATLVTLATVLTARACLPSFSSGPIVEDLPALGPIPAEPGCVLRGAATAAFPCTLDPWTDDTGAPAWSLRGEAPGLRVDAVFVLDGVDVGAEAANEDLFVYALNVDHDDSGRWWSNQEDPTVPTYGEPDRDVNQPFRVTFAGEPPTPVTLRAMARQEQELDGSLVELVARFFPPDEGPSLGR